MKYSSRIARYAASSLDGFVIGILQIPFRLILNFMILPFTNTSSGAPRPLSLFSLGSLLPIVISILFVGPVYFWITTYKYGKSFGKKIFGLEIVDERTGGRLTLRRAFIREVLGKFVSGIVLGLGYIWILWDKKRQGWHDKFAHDVVIQREELTGLKKLIAYALFILGLILPLLAIVFFITTLGLLAVNPQTQLNKANDVKVESDVSILGNAMEGYYSEHGYYPSQLYDLVQDGQISAVPLQPDGYLPYVLELSPEKCLTTLKNCTAVAIRGQLKEPKSTGDDFCYSSSTKTSIETQNCTP